MEKFTNQQAKELFNGKLIISNNDGSIWICDEMEIISSHKDEYEESDYPLLECKFPQVRGFGVKKANFKGLKKTEFIRENFPNNFSSCSLYAKNIQIIKQK